LTLAAAHLSIEKYLLLIDITPWEKISFIVARTFFLWYEMVLHGEKLREEEVRETEAKWREVI
jgi:hypothetical protein